MTDGQWGRRTAAEQAVTSLSSAMTAAIAAIDAVEDPDEAWDTYQRLRDVVRNDATAAVAALRDRLADRIADKHALSLVQLGRRIGVGKARAGQMRDGARAQRVREGTS
jgi:hypothetical protein